MSPNNRGPNHVLKDAKPFLVLTSFISYKNNLDNLLSDCSTIPNIISSKIKKEMVESINNDLSNLSEIIEISTFTSNIDLIDAIYKKADEKNKYFEKILMEALDEIKTSRIDARKTLFDSFKTLIDGKILPPNLMPLFQEMYEDIKDSSRIGTGIDDDQTKYFPKTNDTGILADNIIRIVKEVSAEKQDDLDGCINSITTELQNNEDTRDIFANMDKTMIKNFLAQLTIWLKEKKDAVLRKSTIDFLKNYFKNNKLSSGHEHY